MKHGESVHVRHLHVEKNKVRLQCVNRLDRLPPGTRFANHRKVGMLRQQPQQLLARGWFVIHHQGAKRAHG